MKNTEKVIEQFDMLREEMTLYESLKILLPIYSVKFLESKKRLPEDKQLRTILKSETDVVSGFEKTFNWIENEYNALKGVYKMFPRNKISNELLYQISLKINLLQLQDMEWSTFVSNLIDRFYEQSGGRSSGIIASKIINQLVLKLLEPKMGSLYDGAFRLADFLASVAQNQKLFLYGQEINEQNASLAKLRLLFFDRTDAKLEFGDILSEPMFVEGNHVKKFDYVMIDIPLSKGSAEHSFDNDLYGRYIFGAPPKRNVDWAHIQHAIASLKLDGKAVLVVSNGVLFRGGSEKKIRENIISADLIEAVISLPAGLYTETAIPTNLLIINKNKTQERRDRILFIDTESMFKKTSRNKNEIEHADIDRISKTFKNGKEIKQFSKFVELEDIKDANLLTERYIVDLELETLLFGKVQLENDGLKHKNNTLKEHSETIYNGLNMSNKSIEEGSGKYRLIKLSDVVGGQISMPQLASITLKRNIQIERYQVQEGDVIISSRGKNIKVAVVPEHDEQILLSHNFIGIRFKKNIDPYFLKGYLESPIGMYYLTQNQLGTNVLTINAKDLNEIPIIDVPFMKQKEIGRQFIETEEVYLKKIEQAERERINRTLKLYKDMGIQNMFKIKEE